MTTDPKKTLEKAGKKAEDQKKEARTRAVKGSHLQTKLLEVVGANVNLKQADKTGFVQVSGPGKGKKIYIARKGGRVDFNGFTVTHDAVVQISADDAKAKHLGKVRGQIDFSKSDDAVLEAFTLASNEVASTVAEPAKPPKKVKAPKVGVETGIGETAEGPRAGGTEVLQETAAA